MKTLIRRSYAGEADLQPIADLLNTCEAIDQHDQYYSVSALKLEMTEPGFDPDRDLRLWEDANGRLIGFAQMWIPPEPAEHQEGHLWFRIHPEARQQGLESEAVTWAETRMQAVKSATNLPTKLLASCREHEADRIALFESYKLTYERCFFRMVRSLQQPIPNSVLPSGFQVRYFDETQDLEPWVELYNHTFVDHWGFHTLTVEQEQHWRQDPNYRADLDLLAIAPDGTFAGFCCGEIDVEENQQRGVKEGWIARLGTRRGFRRLGLGRALLLAGLQRLQQEGMEKVLLGVDTENPNQALSLYESVGFQKKHANWLYARWL